MYYLSFGDCKIIGASPELLVRAEDGEVITRPIAGTSRRGATDTEDAALEAELLADEKGAPNTSCSWTCTATTSAGCARRARSRWTG